VRDAGKTGKCEGCGRRLRHGKVCRSCEAEIARQLEAAKRLWTLHPRAIACVVTVRELRREVLPQIRRAAIQGLVLASDASLVQTRLAEAVRRTGVVA